MSEFTLETLVVGQLSTNSYLLIDRREQTALIIDPGDDSDYIVRKLSDYHAMPIGIVATHGHFDHILAAGELQKSFDIPFIMHSADQFLIDRLESSAEHFLGYKVAVLHPTILLDLNKSTTLPFWDERISILKTPGHTPGSICLYIEKEQILLSGDTLFKSGIGRTDFSYASSSLLQQSLENLKKLPPETTVYPGHGQSTHIRQEFAV